MSDSTPLPQSARGPASIAPVDSKPAPRVAFDPLDPQWQNRNGTRDVAAAPAGGASTAGASAAAKARPRAAALDVEALRRKEQADAIVIAARRAFVQGDVSGARAQIEQAAGIDDTNAAGLELLGDIFLSQAEQEEAIQAYRRGAELHPEHAAFEEKAALALLDIEEEKRDKEMAQLFLENPGLNRWAERKPSLAAMLSLLVPGSGQVYNDQAELGGVLFGGALLSFGGWYWILDRATASLSGRGGRQLLSGAGEALAQMGGLARLGFWVLVLAWVGVVLFAMADAYRGAVEANRTHRPFEV